MSKSLKYPYSWGETVVNDFVSRYGRGTYNFALTIGISVGELKFYLINILCSGISEKWETVKRQIIDLELLSTEIIRNYDPAEVRLLHKCFVLIHINIVKSL